MKQYNRPEQKELYRMEMSNLEREIKDSGWFPTISKKCKDDYFCQAVGIEREGRLPVDVYHDIDKAIRQYICKRDE